MIVSKKSLGSVFVSYCNARNARIKNINCKISFFSDIPVRSEWSELQSQEHSEQKIPEVSPFGMGTAVTQYFCSFVNLSLLQ